MQREALSVQREKAVLASCILPEMDIDPHDPLGELRSLVDTAGAIVVDELIQRRTKPDPTAFIGSGKVEELATLVRAREAEVVIFDNDLTPRQIANIEKTVECKVLDRSELILDIFAARAKTYEAKLQVELAQLEYTYPRLRAMWSHLERIVGGAPAGIGTRGPGEQQLEIDRRIVQRRKAELKREIESIQGRKQREVQQRNQDFFTVGLVGYTNAGKSTLFNMATDGGAYADDKLFATLSTRTRKWDLGEGDVVMLSDTVGFVRNLPHHLVASFKATLEEAVHSDLLLVVVDVAEAHAPRRLATVMNVLDEIGATDQPRLVVLNKIDVLEHNADMLAMEAELADHIALSAKTGRGMDQLIDRLRFEARGGTAVRRISLPLREGKAINFLETRAVVEDRQYVGDRAIFTARIGNRQLDQLRAMGADMDLLDESREPTTGWSAH